MAPRLTPRLNGQSVVGVSLAGDGKYAGLSLLQLTIFAIEIEERAEVFGPEFNPDDLGEKNGMGLVRHDLAHLAVKAH